MIEPGETVHDTKPAYTYAAKTQPQPCYHHTQTTTPPLQPKSSYSNGQDLIENP